MSAEQDLGRSVPAVEPVESFTKQTPGIIYVTAAKVVSNFTANFATLYCSAKTKPSVRNVV